jgi:hypothetical protein
MFVHTCAAVFWPRRTLLAFGHARARDYLLPPLSPAACEHVRRLRPREHVAYRRCRYHGTDVGGVSLAAGNGAVWPGARRKEHAIGGRKCFLCYVN